MNRTKLGSRGETSAQRAAKRAVWRRTAHVGLGREGSTSLSRDLVLQCPMIKREGDKEVPEPFAEMARFFTESHLLQRDIKLLPESM